jgi:hypothetical protein
MPFGLWNAPETFQREMDKIFKDISWKFVIPYLDDIIICSNSVEEHEKTLKKVLNRLEKAGLSLNITKCKFFKE